MNKQKYFLLLISIVMFGIGSGLLTHAISETFFIAKEQADLAVINPLEHEFWEQERDDGGYYTIVDEKGNVLDKTARVVYVGDEIIVQDNKQYRVEKVEGDTAIAKLVIEDALADYKDFAQEVFNLQVSQANAQTANKRIALYHTHSAESYVPTDGTDSIPANGGIFKVGEAIKSVLTEKGINVEYSQQPHEPRDSNAYRRSRRTALDLLKTGPAAIIDVHRDGVPDPDFYSTEVAGNKATSIRLVVGRQNQNMQANLDFAKQIKAGMDQIYPGLIKSIFMAKGNYNQDLSPRSMLIEVGTHTNDRYEAENGGKLFADGLPVVLGIAGPNPTTESTTSTNQGDWTSLWWILGISLIGGAAFLLLNSGSLKGAADKLKRFTSTELTNFMGNLNSLDDKDKGVKSDISEDECNRGEK